MKIIEICNIRAGTSFPRKPKHSENGDYWVLESFCLDVAGNINFADLVHVSSHDMRPPSMSLRTNDILIRSKGAKHQAILFNEPAAQQCICPTSYFLVLTVTQFELVIPEFLVWLLNQPQYQQALSGLAGGATVKHLTKTRLTTLTLDIPPLDKQQQILSLAGLIQQETALIAEIAALRHEYYLSTTSTFLEGKP